jgi:hypothetical protein
MSKNLRKKIAEVFSETRVDQACLSSVFLTIFLLLANYFPVEKVMYVMAFFFFGILLNLFVRTSKEKKQWFAVNYDIDIIILFLYQKDFLLVGIANGYYVFKTNRMIIGNENNLVKSNGNNTSIIANDSFINQIKKELKEFASVKQKANISNSLVIKYNRAKNEQIIPTIKKNILLYWIYKQKNNVPVDDLMEFTKSHSKTSKIIKIDKKTKMTNSSQLQ